MAEKFSNRFRTTVGAGGIASGATSLPVSDPAPTGLQGGEFRVLVGTDSEIAAGTAELLLVTATGAAGASPWTVTRGIEGSNGLRAHAAGVNVRHVLTERGLVGLVVPPWLDVGNLNAARTVYAGQPVRGVLNQACTITVSTIANDRADLMTEQDGTGGKQVTWSGVNVWKTNSGTAPSLAGRPAGAVDRFSFENIAGIVYGYWLTETIATGGARNTSAYSRAGAIAENIPRVFVAYTAVGVLSTGRGQMVGIELFAGQAVASAVFHSEAAMSGPTNQWAALYNASRSLLVTGVDQTTTAWGADSDKTFPFASTYTVPTSGLYYVMLVIVATTVPTLRCFNAGAELATAPLVTGSVNTGLTTPATAPATTAVIAATGNWPRLHLL